MQDQILGKVNLLSYFDVIVMVNIHKSKANPEVFLSDGSRTARIKPRELHRFLNCRWPNSSRQRAKMIALESRCPNIVSGKVIIFRFTQLDYSFLGNTIS